MKDSGVQWIGEIPKEWEVGKVHKYYRFQTGFTPASEKTDYYDDKGAEWITISDLTGKRIIPSETKKHISNLYLQEFKPVVCPTGSLLYSFKLSVGQTAFVDRDIYTNEAIACFFPNDSLRFLFYSSSLIENNAQINIYGAKLLNQKRIYDAPIVYPPLDEQLRIADFLDAKCAEIDSVLEKTKASIEEYKKLKQSVITEAVTKGIRGNRPMKDSGVEWIGEMPTDWKLLPLKHLFVRRSQKNNPIISTERLSLSIDIGITKYADKTTNLDRFKDDFSQYQLAYPDDIVLNSMNMIVGAVGKSPFFGCVSPVYYVIYPRGSADVGYWSYLLNCMKIRDVYHSLGQGIYAIERGEGRVNTCRLKVPYDDFGRIMVSTPSYEEQQEIAAYLDSKCAAIDALIASKEALVAELESYKKSIIYEYVTGKKEVPTV